MSNAGVTFYLLYEYYDNGTNLVKVFTFSLLYTYRILGYILIVLFTSPECQWFPHLATLNRPTYFASLMAG